MWGQQRLWDMLGGEGGPTGEVHSSRLPENPCAHLTVCLPHSTQRPLSAAVSHSSTARSGTAGSTQGGYVSTHDHYHHQKTRNQWLGAPWNLPQTPSRPQHQHPSVRRLLQLRAGALPISQWLSPVGVHAWAAKRWTFLHESPHLAVRITNRPTVFSFALLGPARASEKPHSPPRKRRAT